MSGLGSAASPRGTSQVTLEQKQLLDTAAERISESTAKSLLAVTRWAHDKSWRESHRASRSSTCGSHRT